MAVKVKNKKGVTCYVEESRLAGLLKRGFQVVEEGASATKVKSKGKGKGKNAQAKAEVEAKAEAQTEGGEDDGSYKEELEAMTNDDLIEMAEQLELSPKKKATKAELVKMLLESSE